MNAYQVDLMLQLARHNPPCRCGHALDIHDMDDPKGHCMEASCGGGGEPCAAYSHEPCLVLDPSHLPCTKPIGHDGPHYMYRGGY